MEWIQTDQFLLMLKRMVLSSNHYDAPWLSLITICCFLQFLQLHLISIILLQKLLLIFLII